MVTLISVIPFRKPHQSHWSDEQKRDKRAKKWSVFTSTLSSIHPTSKPGLIRFFFSTLGKFTPSRSLYFSPPVPLLLWVWEIHSVLYQGVVRALCLHTLLNSSNDPRQTSVQGGQVRLGQDRLDRVKSQRLPHGRTQGSASQQVQPVPGGHANPDTKKKGKTFYGLKWRW